MITEISAWGQAALEHAVSRAVQRLDHNDSDLLTLGVGERAVMFHLARYLLQQLEPLGAWHLDVEYNRQTTERRQVSKHLPGEWREVLRRKSRSANPSDDALILPDIILHKRGSKEENLLVVELKIDSSPLGDDMKVDIAKLHGYREVLLYRHAVMINLRTNGRHEWFWLPESFRSTGPELGPVRMAPIP